LAEFEELRIYLSLDDRVSEPLKAIQNSFNAIGQSQANIVKLQRSMEETTSVIQPVQQQTSTVASTFLGLAGTAGLAAGAVVAIAGTLYAVGRSTLRVKTKRGIGVGSNIEGQDHHKAVCRSPDGGTLTRSPNVICLLNCAAGKASSH
jgi:hypothetical protein